MSAITQFFSPVTTPLTNGLFSVLVFFYQTTGNLGFAIIVLTVIIRLVLLPLSLPSLKARNKMLEIQPELKKLQQKHKGNRQALNQAQIELYRKYNVNPLSGCIPQLVQVALIIFLYNALGSFLGQSLVNGVDISPAFFWLNLGLPDKTLVLPVLTAVTQLVLSLMITPGGEVRDVVPNAAKNKRIKEENKKEEDVADMAATMQKQMIFMLPVIMGVAAMTFPSGLALYLVTTTLFSIVQQYFISGLGGLQTYTRRIVSLVSRS